jgi:hypothetical protein
MQLVGLFGDAGRPQALERVGFSDVHGIVLTTVPSLTLPYITPKLFKTQWHRVIMDAVDMWTVADPTKGRRLQIARDCSATATWAISHSNSNSTWHLVHRLLSLPASVLKSRSCGRKLIIDLPRRRSSSTTTPEADEGDEENKDENEDKDKDQNKDEKKKLPSSFKLVQKRTFAVANRLSDDDEDEEPVNRKRRKPDDDHDAAGAKETLCCLCHTQRLLNSQEKAASGCPLHWMCTACSIRWFATYERCPVCGHMQQFSGANDSNSSNSTNKDQLLQLPETFGPIPV